MSSTNRGKARKRNDNYPTPAWVVHRILEHDRIRRLASCPLWIEPGVGNGAIVQATSGLITRSGYSRPTWHVFDKRETPFLTRMKHGTVLDVTDVSATKRWLKGLPGVRLDRVVIGNPPFSHARRFIDVSREAAANVLLLLRLNFLGSEERASFIRGATPDVYVLPNRPSFVKNGKTDSIEYAWFHWHALSGRGDGRLCVLNTTPKAERKQ
jgi:hypothetical protein